MRPGMSDGRAFTNYLSNCQMNSIIQEKNNISNDAAYRKFLQENAKAIMEAQQSKPLK